MSNYSEIVLGKLDKLVKQFVYEVCIQRGYPELQGRDAGGKIYTFGSYRLGVHGAGTPFSQLDNVDDCMERVSIDQLFPFGWWLP